MKIEKMQSLWSIFTISVCLILVSAMVSGLVTITTQTKNISNDIIDVEVVNVVSTPIKYDIQSYTIVKGSDGVLYKIPDVKCGLVGLKFKIRKADLKDINNE